MHILQLFFLIIFGTNTLLNGLPTSTLGGQPNDGKEKYRVLADEKFAQAAKLNQLIKDITQPSSSARTRLEAAREAAISAAKSYEAKCTKGAKAKSMSNETVFATNKAMTESSRYRFHSIECAAKETLAALTHPTSKPRKLHLKTTMASPSHSVPTSFEYDAREANINPVHAQSTPSNHAAFPNFGFLGNQLQGPSVYHPILATIKPKTTDCPCHAIHPITPQIIHPIPTLPLVLPPPKTYPVPTAPLVLGSDPLPTDDPAALPNPSPHVYHRIQRLPAIP
jgi:hypothetical protein